MQPAGNEVAKSPKCTHSMAEHGQGGSLCAQQYCIDFYTNVGCIHTQYVRGSASEAWPQHTRSGTNLK